jgi:hypothetical protein
MLASIIHSAAPDPQALPEPTQLGKWARPELRVRDQHSIVSFDRPLDNLGFLSEKFRQILLYVVRG